MYSAGFTTSYSTVWNTDADLTIFKAKVNGWWAFQTKAHVLTVKANDLTKIS